MRNIPFYKRTPRAVFFTTAIIKFLIHYFGVGSLDQVFDNSYIFDNKESLYSIIDLKETYDNEKAPINSGLFCALSFF